MIIGTAGHIDHGKTSLVRALAARTNDPSSPTHASRSDRTDRLKEERERGITVDLGFAYVPMPALSAAAPERAVTHQTLGFVDVPGHEKLVRNMLAGATGIDAVMLVVAADDGPMPQTREHVAILKLLNIQRGVVALTKRDLVSPERLAEVQAQTRSMLEGSPLQDIDVVPVSSTTGQGLDSLWSAFTGLASQNTQANGRRAASAGPFRLAIDRSFSLPGVGTVLTGTAASGEVRVGDRLLISPRGNAVRVRGIHAQNAPSDLGCAGQRLAINVVGIDKDQAHRGDWLLHESVHAPTQTIDARLSLLSTEQQALRHDAVVHVHLAACDVVAHVRLYEGSQVKPGEQAWVQLELSRPMGALRGDRMVLRDASASRTIGGGTVLDIVATHSRRHKAERVLQLKALELGGADFAGASKSLAALLALKPAAGVDSRAFKTLHNLDETAYVRLLQSVAHRALEDGSSTLLFAAEQLEGYEQAIESHLKTHHERTPDSPGLTQEQLQRSVKHKPKSTVFVLLLRLLVQRGSIERAGAHLRLKGYEATLQGQEKQLWERIKPWLDEGGIHPPKLSDMFLRDRSLRKDQVMRVLERLQRMGKVHAVGAEYFIQTQHVLELALACEKLALADPNRRVNIKELRDATGMSRHLSVPLVEFFDAVGYTKRDAVGRHIRRDARAMFGGHA